MIATLAEITRTCIRHYKEGNINWPMAIYLALTHIGIASSIFKLSPKLIS